MSFWKPALTNDQLLERLRDAERKIRTLEARIERINSRTKALVDELFRGEDSWSQYSTRFYPHTYRLKEMEAQARAQHEEAQRWLNGIERKLSRIVKELEWRIRAVEDKK